MDPMKPVVPAPRAQFEKPQWLKWLLISVPVGLLGVAFVGAMFWGLAIGYSVPAEPVDRQALLRFEHVTAAHGDLGPKLGVEALTRTRFIDGTFSADYEYEDDGLFISSSIYHERRSTDARALYATMKVSMPLAVTAFGEDLEVTEGKRFSGGDASYSAVIMSSGVPVGHLVLVRKGNNVMTVMLSGVYLGPSDALERMVLPKVDMMSSSY